MIQVVFDHLWQSTLFAVLAGLLTLVCRRDRADIRFALWFAASLKFLIPFPLIVLLGRSLRWRAAPAIEIASPWSETLDQVAQPASALTAGPAAPFPATLSAVEPSHWGLSSVLFWGLWAVGAAFLLARWAWQGWSIAKAVRHASPLPIEAPLPARSMPDLPQPGVFGIFRPVLLFPEAIFAELTPGQLAAILSHELCHWRRRDNLTAALHMLVEALFWFHPLVWWLGTRLVVEREQACDEAVIHSGSDRQDYAEGILKVCQLSVGQQPFFMAGVSGGDLVARIERIMKAPLSRSLSPVRKFLLAAAGCLAVLGPIAIGMAVISPRQIAAQEEVQINPAVLDHYVGYYDVPPFSVLAVTRDGDQLRVQRNGRSHMQLFAETERDFSPRSIQAKLTFVVDGAGSATAMIWNERGTDHVYRRIDAARAAAIDSFRAERLQANEAMPGGETVLRRYIAYGGRGGDEPFVGAELASLGSLQSLTFEGVVAGWDIYHAHFAEGDWELRLVLTADGHIQGLEHQSFRPAKRLALAEIGTIRPAPPQKDFVAQHNKAMTEAMESGDFPPQMLPRNRTLEFINSSDANYQLYCIDFKGDFHSYGPLPPHTMSVQRIYDMDKWVVGRDRQHPVAAFAATSGLTVATIE